MSAARLNGFSNGVVPSRAHFGATADDVHEADALAELLTLFVDHARPLDRMQLAARVLARVTPYPQPTDPPRAP